MTKRSLVMLFVLTAVTGGLYDIYWLVATKREMVARGAAIPSAWLLLVPVANLYWVWKHCQGVAQVTDGQMSAAAALLWQIVLPGCGQLVVQHALNRVAGRATVSYAKAA
ncbi:MAG TPA: DUF4234 domain-containing protein [Polyangia bacterium]|jgi:hypothetical protein